MNDLIPTSAVCALLRITEPALRHILRRAGAPRPSLHPSARIFLWSSDDVLRLQAFIDCQREVNR